MSDITRDVLDVLRPFAEILARKEQFAVEGEQIGKYTLVEVEHVRAVARLHATLSTAPLPVGLAQRCLEALHDRAVGTCDMAGLPPKCSLCQQHLSPPDRQHTPDCLITLLTNHLSAGEGTAEKVFAAARKVVLKSAGISPEIEKLADALRLHDAGADSEPGWVRRWNEKTGLYEYVNLGADSGGEGKRS